MLGELIFYYLIAGVIVTWIADRITRIDGLSTLLIFILLWPVTITIIIYGFIEAMYENREENKNDINR